MVRGPAQGPTAHKSTARPGVLCCAGPGPSRQPASTGTVKLAFTLQLWEGLSAHSSHPGSPYGATSSLWQRVRERFRFVSLPIPSLYAPGARNHL